MSEIKTFEPVDWGKTSEGMIGKQSWSFEYWKYIREEISREHGLINNRLGWAISYSSFGIAGVAIIMGRLLDPSARGDHIVLLMGLGMQTMFAGSGLAVTIASCAAANLALARIDEWHILRKELLTELRSWKKERIAGAYDVERWVCRSWRLDHKEGELPSGFFVSLNAALATLRRRPASEDSIHQYSMKVVVSTIPRALGYLWIFILAISLANVIARWNPQHSETNDERKAVLTKPAKNLSDGIGSWT